MARAMHMVRSFSARFAALAHRENSCSIRRLGSLTTSADQMRTALGPIGFSRSYALVAGHDGLC